MGAGRRVLAILAVVAAFFLVAAPAWADSADNCALTGNGELYCWGRAAPVRVRVTGRVVQLAASGDSTCALTEPGEVYCWGAASPARGPDVSPLLLVTIGSLLIAGGTTLVTTIRRR